MDASYVRGLLERYAHLPRFPDGRVDFTRADSAPVLSCLVRYGDEFLLLKRSPDMYLAGKWCPVMGFLDEPVSVRDKVLEELEEELGLDGDAIRRVSFGEPFEARDDDAGKVWRIHPVLVDLKGKVSIRLDREHSAVRWVPRGDFRGLETMARFEKVVSRLEPSLDE